MLARVVRITLTSASCETRPISTAGGPCLGFRQQRPGEPVQPVVALARQAMFVERHFGAGKAKPRRHPAEDRFRRKAATRPGWSRAGEAGWGEILGKAAALLGFGRELTQSLVPKTFSVAGRRSK